MLFDLKTVQLFKNVLRDSKYLDLPAEGTSMFPFIQEGDLCRFSECNPLRLKKGEVVLFYTNSGQLIAHRFYERKDVDGKMLYFFKGDTNLGIDQPIKQEQIIGKLFYVKKEKSIMYASHILAKVWRALIVHYPIISSILNKYVNYKYRITYR